VSWAHRRRPVGREDEVADVVHLVLSRIRLVERGLDVKQLREKRNVLQFEITKKKLKQDELMHFSRQLSAFVRAGIPLIESLEVIEEETDDKVLREVLIGVRDSLTTGETFSDALRPYESLFPKFYVDMVRAAELTGSLDNPAATVALWPIFNQRGDAIDMAGDQVAAQFIAQLQRALQIDGGTFAPTPERGPA